ncbi:hypothetical protein ABTJ98_20890, partial [Acinetobacter baumannii]
YKSSTANLALAAKSEAFTIPPIDNPAQQRSDNYWSVATSSGSHLMTLAALGDIGANYCPGHGILAPLQQAFPIFLGSGWAAVFL